MLTLIAALWTTASLACDDLMLPPDLILDPEAEDERAPGTPDVLDVALDFDLADGGCDNPCPDRAILTVWFGDTVDDQTPPEEMGYVVRILEGEVPEGVIVPDRPFTGPEATFVWAVDRQVALAGIRLVFELRAVDIAGNISQGAVTVDIDQPAIYIPFVSCSQTGPSWPLLGMLPLMALRRRRREG